MNKIIIILFASAICLSSCGPSREEIEANLLQAQAIQDSIAAQTRRENERQERLKAALIDLKAELAGAQTKLQSIHEFKILRTQNEKAQQVAEQTREIEILKSRIEEVTREIR